MASVHRIAGKGFVVGIPGNKVFALVEVSPEALRAKSWSRREREAAGGASRIGDFDLVKNCFEYRRSPAPGEALGKTVRKPNC